MKKLIILPVLFLTLMLSGCASKYSEEQVNNLINQENNKNNAEIAKLQDQINQLKESIKSESVQANTSTEQVQFDYSGWQEYKTEKYDYTIKYPKNWYLDGEYSNKDFSLRGPVNDRDYIGGDTIFSNYKNPRNFNKANTPKDLRQVSLLVYKFDKSKTIVDFYNSKNYSARYDKVIINGQEALKISNTCSFNILLKKEDKVYVLNYNEYQCDGVEREEAEIVNSFEFLE